MTVESFFALVGVIALLFGVLSGASFLFCHFANLKLAEKHEKEKVRVEIKARQTPDYWKDRVFQLHLMLVEAESHLKRLTEEKP